MRTYKTGTTWCLWRWTITDSQYITRLHLVKTPWFAVCLHWLNKPDPDPFLHDHPVSFLSIVLRGGYTELRSYTGEPYHIRVVRRLNRVSASLPDKHRIIEVLPNTMTLVFMGPKVREWGFHTPQGWVYWRDYYASNK